MEIFVLETWNQVKYHIPFAHFASGIKSVCTFNIKMSCNSVTLHGITSQWPQQEHLLPFHTDPSYLHSWAIKLSLLPWTKSELCCTVRSKCGSSLQLFHPLHRKINLVYPVENVKVSCSLEMIQSRSNQAMLIQSLGMGGGGGGLEIAE